MPDKCLLNEWIWKFAYRFDRYRLKKKNKGRNSRFIHLKLDMRMGRGERSKERRYKTVGKT